ncbi:MAG: NAD(P)/FAD-dependent oxidoreductase [Oscillospiraceae bacterium]|nr:NAD(P)/FAD-dependent oxidoreductase [Oscillospiraceae bacterium]
MKYENLFTPGKIGNVEIKNRIVMTSMGVDVAEPNGKVGQRWMDYYAARSKGEVGLIISGIVRVNETTGIGLPMQVSMARDKNIESLREGVEMLHANGTKFFVQLHHAGRQNEAILSTTWGLVQLGEKFIPNYWNYAIPLCRKLMGVIVPPMENNPTINNLQKYVMLPNVSASNVPLDTSRNGAFPARVHPLTIPEIKLLEKQFIDAAVRCQKAGVDGVELHASHGYLLQQFLSPWTNRRHDRYGGSLENRMRFMLEIISGIQEKCGKDYPICVRLTMDEMYSTIGDDGKGLTIDEGIQIAKRLEQAGVAALDLSVGGYETPNHTVEPINVPQGWRTYMVKAIKDAVNIPIIAVGVIREPDFADKLIEDGVQDFIGLARPLLADPEWALKAKEGRTKEIQRCVGCLACFQSLFENAFRFESCECALNPKCCREIDYKNMPKNGAGRKVVVIGAGPAGLTAARELAARDFDVTVLEKEKVSGGQLNAANKPPHKEKIDWAINDLTNRAKVAGAKIKYSQEVTEDSLRELDPYAIVVATGGKAGVPMKIPGADQKHVMTGADAMMNKLNITDKNVVVVGTGLTGLETAEYFMAQGNHVTLVEMQDKIGPGLYVQHYYDLYPKLAEGGALFLTSAKLTEIGENDVVVEVKGGGKVQPKADYVFFAAGVRSVNELVPVAKSVCRKVYAVGDANKVGTIKNATSSALQIAKEIN